MLFYRCAMSLCGSRWVLSHQVCPSEFPGCVREEREVKMGSSSSSYAPQTIYLDVDGKVQKVGPILAEKQYFYSHLTVYTLNQDNSVCGFTI